MVKRLVYIFICISSFSYAQWIPLDDSSLPGTKPNVQLISDDAFSTVIKVDLAGFYLNRFENNRKSYHSISIGEEAITTEPGFPEIPHIAKILAIPDRGTVSVEVLEMSTVQVIDGINVPPARASWKEGDPETQYIEDVSCYEKENLYPSELVKIDDPAVFRDFRISRVSIFPIRFSPSRQQIQAVTSLTIRVKYSGGIGINPKTTPQRPIAPSFDKVYKNSIFNYKEVLQHKYGGRLEGHDFMLCIVPDLFYESLQPYAEWKNISGTKIHVTKFSEIGANENNPVAVKNHIAEAYSLWPETPTHILIVGDKGKAPVQYWSGAGWSFVNEDWFVEITDDFFPDMMIGRFTSTNDATLQVIVNKEIVYEKTPYVGGGDWFKKGIVCSNNNYASQLETKRFTKDEMLLFGNFVSVDTMMCGLGYNKTQIVNAINSGRSYLNYRGEGWTTGWNTNCYNYDLSVSDVTSLNNTNKLTFVTSIGCGVAMFDASTECFGESWLESGTLTNVKGGCGFIGPTSNTHTTYNNKIDKGIYMGMFEEGMDSPGEAILRGKLYMYEIYGTDPFVEYHYKIYCVIGDPSLHIWKDIPKPVEAAHPDTITTGFNQFQILVTDSVSGTPVANARICISGSGVYVNSITDSLGIAQVTVIPTIEGQLNIWVTGGNVVPYNNIISVILGVENVTPTGDAVVTDLDGNDDGLVNPNEHGTITYTLKNWGTATSLGVFAQIFLDDTSNFVEIITTDSISFGNLAPGDSLIGTPFQFFIKPECPVRYSIPFKLHVWSSTSSWYYTQNVQVHGCNLQFGEYTVEDSGNILHNYRLDPGETAIMKIKVLNIGDDIAPDVSGILITSDPYLSIIDSIGSYGLILFDSSATNYEDYFIVKIDENCPLQDTIDAVLKLSTKYGLYPYFIELPVILQVSMPAPPDPTGPDAYGYYAYSSADTLWDQVPEYNWFEINTIGTQIPKPGGLSDFTVNMNLPFTFKYYGNEQSQVRISSDGWIAFGPGTQTKSENSLLPCLDTINNMAAAFWDDLFTENSAGSGKLYYYNDEVNHRFVVEWFDVAHRIDTTSKETFQIILLDPVYYPTSTADGEIIFQYKFKTDEGSCTIGIENNTEDVGLLYMYNELYNPTANLLVNDLAIKFTTNGPTITDVNRDAQKSILPVKYSLEQNYPNPFNPSTKIRYSIPEQGHVTLKIYRIDGELIRTLQDENQNAGSYTRLWDGKSDGGYTVSSGVYFYRIHVNNFTEVKKMILLK